MQAFWAAFLFIALAEMGDKTQLLVLGFASRYSAVKVLWGVFLATALNHALAVVVGHYLTVFLPMGLIQGVAALSFVLFGLWTLHGDSIGDEARKPSRYGPVVTVAIAFFLAEMGDKTQLATVSLAVQYQNMGAVLLGTTLGMIVADAIAIIVGIIMRKHIPENIVTWIAALLFIGFGWWGVWDVLQGVSSQLIAASVVFVIACITVYVGWLLVKQKKRSVL